jgi:hypothetical protein
MGLKFVIRCLTSGVSLLGFEEGLLVGLRGYLIEVDKEGNLVNSFLEYPTDQTGVTNEH